MFVFFCIVFVLAAIAAAVWVASKHPEKKKNRYGEELYADVDTKKVAGFIALGLGILSAILLVFSSVAYVPANHVGVVTQFGTWGGTAHSGISWTAPWSSVDTFPTRNQKSIRDQADGNGPCVSVKLQGNASACVDLTVLYTIDENNAEKLWRGWGSFSKLNSDLIDRSTDDATNQVMSGYKAEDLPTNRNEITANIQAALSQKITPQGVHLESVTLGDTHLPKEVQDRINSILEADAKVQVAKKGEEQAKAEALSAQARQSSLTSEALIKACLDAAREIKPQYFDCGLGGTANKPSVILGGQR